MTIYTVKLNPKARVEYLEAFVWYEEQSPGLGFRFESCVQAKLNAIATNPLLYQHREYDTRQIKVPDFPYLIVCKLFPKKKTLVIVSIFHMKRHPHKKI